jgi:hypothetical protein
MIHEESHPDKFFIHPLYIELQKTSKIRRDYGIQQHFSDKG